MENEHDIGRLESNTDRPDVQNVLWHGYREGRPVGEVVAELLSGGARAVTADEVRRCLGGLSEFVGRVAEALEKGGRGGGAGR